MAEIIADATGEEITSDLLDQSMSLVVNDSEEPFTLISEHGNEQQRALISDLIEQEWIEEARERGAQDARAAAWWITDGNDSDDSRRRKLALIEDRRLHEIMTTPNLSGEWADDPTPTSLAREISGLVTLDGVDVDALADAYEEGVSERFEQACEQELRR